MISKACRFCKKISGTKIHLKKNLIWPFSLEFSNEENELSNIKFLLHKKLRKLYLCKVLYAKNCGKPVPMKRPEKYRSL